jgi:hypothetical protein
VEYSELQLTNSSCPIVRKVRKVDPHVPLNLHISTFFSGRTLFVTDFHNQIVFALNIFDKLLLPPPSYSGVSSASSRNKRDGNQAKRNWPSSVLLAACQRPSGWAEGRVMNPLSRTQCQGVLSPPLGGSGVVHPASRSRVVSFKHWKHQQHPPPVLGSGCCCCC